MNGLNNSRKQKSGRRHQGITIKKLLNRLKLLVGFVTFCAQLTTEEVNTRGSTNFTTIVVHDITRYKSTLYTT